MMDPELRDLLHSVGVEGDDQSHTHITYYGPNSRWAIDTQKNNEFWGTYCDLVSKKSEEEERKICLAERAQKIMPLISVLTFKFDVDDNDDEKWEPYDDGFLQLLCYTYQKVLDQFFKIDDENTDMELLTVILESENHWFENDAMVMEVRIQFPYARIDVKQNDMIRKRVIQLLRNNNIMSKMQRQPLGDWEKIINTVKITDPIVMYGSNKNMNQPPLILTHIWHKITDNMLELNEVPQNINLEDAFHPENHFDVQQGTVDANIFKNKDIDYWIPIFLSIGHWRKILLPRQRPQGKLGNNYKSINNIKIFGNSTNKNFDNNESEIDLADKMLQIMDEKRFHHEPYWIDIGKALYAADHGRENGLLSWIRNSEKSLQNEIHAPEYMMTAGNINDTCRNLYNTFANSNITIKTLAWYAREDNPIDYANWHRDWCLSSMEVALSCAHTDVAIAFHRVYWLDFVYCASGKGRWFHFHNHRWVEINNGIEVRKSISGDFMKRFESVRTTLCAQIHESTDDTFKNNGELTIKKITQIISKLKVVAYKNSILSESCEHFNNNKFLALLDSNPELMGVTNGILEVYNNTINFRSSKPEDYISMCSNIPFNNDYSFTHPLVKECLKWFGQVFTDRELLHHFLKFSASCLKGRNSDKIFPIWTGEGDNSKSMIVKIFEATFSSYCIKFPISLLTEKGANSSGPTPQLARAKATKIAFIDEPEDDVPMNKGTIKRYTGGDSFFARLLQENGGDVQATFKMILMCNKVPIIPNADKAIKNRTRLFPFMSTWTDNPPESETEQIRLRQFKKNPIFERRIPILAPAFLWLMTQYYPYYADEGLEDPPIVTETTEAYWRDNDVYAQFVADTIQPVYLPNGSRDPSARLTLTEIYAEFKNWFRDAFPGTKVPERAIVRTELSSRWGRMQSNGWFGITMSSGDSPSDILASLGNKPKPSTSQNSISNTPITKSTTPQLVVPHRSPHQILFNKEVIKIPDTPAPLSSNGYTVTI